MYSSSALNPHTQQIQQRCRHQSIGETSGEGLWVDSQGSGEVGGERVEANL